MNNIIFATKSIGRKNIISNIGINDVLFLDNLTDENKLKSKLEKENVNILDFSKKLAYEKTINLSKKNIDDYIIGFDQVLIFNNQILNKPSSKKELAIRLKNFSGKKHILQSSICITKNSKIIMEETEQAIMYVRNMSDEFINNYVKNYGEKFLNSVGGYHFEEEGIQIFEKIEGNFHTIIGMPIFGLLNFLRNKGKLIK